MKKNGEHITVCICTFKRPLLLKKLLEELSQQQTDNLFTFSVVVSDNDSGQSARDVVTQFAELSPVPVSYRVEPQRNIALARNLAVAGASGDFIAFLDDDEYPPPTWLRDLLLACNAHCADGALGPVIPYYEGDPPQWVIRARFYEASSHTTGARIGGAGTRDMRTANVLFRRKIIDGLDTPFLAEFGNGGEDVDFFRRMIAKGHIFIWCDEAPVYEMVPRARYQRSYLLRRALNRGVQSFTLPGPKGRHLAKALVAVPLYGLSLPFLLLLGQHHFMKYLVKICDHTGMLLGFLRIRPFNAYK